MNPVDTVPLMLLALHMLALGVGTIVFIGMILLHRRAHAMQQSALQSVGLSSRNSESKHNPVVWLAVRSPNLKMIQAALGMGYTVPCPWAEGISGEHEFFIGSPVNGWAIVTGSGLPYPSHDIDDFFHFLIRLSRALGHVQFFCADPTSYHHAWIYAENGIVKRAYVWANETIWNQGVKSLAEIELNIKCFGYGEHTGVNDRALKEIAAINIEKIPLLAARWSVNPVAINENLLNPTDGIAGKLSRFCQD